MHSAFRRLREQFFKPSNLEGSGPGNSTDRCMAHHDAVDDAGADHIHGWAGASSRVLTTYISGLLDRQVGREYVDGDHDPSQVRMDTAERHSAQRQGDSYRTLHSSWRYPHLGDDCQ